MRTMDFFYSGIFSREKGKPGAPGPGTTGGVPGQPMGDSADMGRDGLALGSQGSLSSQYAGPGGGLSSYGTPGLASVGSQMPSSLGSAAGGYGGLGGPLGSSSQYVGPGSGGYRGYGMGLSLYCIPLNSGGVPSSGYPESGHYPLSSLVYQSQHHQPSGTSPGQRVPSAGLYPNVPPYY